MRLTSLCFFLLAVGVVARPQAEAQLANTTRVSVSSSGTEGNGQSGAGYLSLSADGRFAAFESEASNLVPGDTNGAGDIFVHDRLTGITTRVSIASDGTEADGFSDSPALSADGRFAAFYSAASNLVPGDTNGAEDIFVHDRLTGSTTRVSIASNGTEGNGRSNGFPVISGNGRFVAFESEASNLVPGDTNGAGDIFVHDRLTGITTRVSIASDGTEIGGGGDFTMTPDGRFVAFPSAGDVLVHDRLTLTTTKVSVASDGSAGNHSSQSPAISADGRFIVFSTYATNLAPSGTCGLVVHDRQTATTTSVLPLSTCQTFSQPSISADGRFYAFSTSDSLVPGDTNEERDMYVHDLFTGITTKVGDGGQDGAISADGRCIVFNSLSPNLLVGDTNDTFDVFVFEYLTSNTLVGEEVTVQPVDVTTGTIPLTLTLSGVTQAGWSSLATINTGPPVPGGFSLGAPPRYYDVTTTATFTGARICIAYDPAEYSNANDLHLLHQENDTWVDVTISNDTTSHVICGQVSSLSLLVVTQRMPLAAQIQQPINADGSSLFNASRGVVPVKFTLTSGGVFTCDLPPATIALTRTGGPSPGSIDEAVYVMAADIGSNFRIANCQYVYNLAAKSLGPGSYLASIKINSVTVGSARFDLK